MPGIILEYIQELAKNSDLQFEIVDTGSWSEAYDKLVKERLIFSLPFTIRRNGRKRYCLSLSRCSIYTTLNVRMDDERYAYEDFTAFESMKVGIIRGGVDGERFKEFCKNNGSLWISQSTMRLTDYWVRWKMDIWTVWLSRIWAKNSSFRSVAQFSPSPLYLTVTAKSPGCLMT